MMYSCMHACVCLHLLPMIPQTYWVVHACMYASTYVCTHNAPVCMHASMYACTHKAPEGCCVLCVPSLAPAAPLASTPANCFTVRENAVAPVSSSRVRCLIDFVMALEHWSSSKRNTCFTCVCVCVHVCVCVIDFRHGT